MDTHPQPQTLWSSLASLVKPRQFRKLEQCEQRIDCLEQRADDLISQASEEPQTWAPLWTQPQN